jgi:hypothetical protein
LESVFNPVGERPSADISPNAEPNSARRNSKPRFFKQALRVIAVAKQPDGKILAGGYFSNLGGGNYNGGLTSSNIVRAFVTK